jgi:hypothetical protein
MKVGAKEEVSLGSDILGGDYRRVQAVQCISLPLAVTLIIQ